MSEVGVRRSAVVVLAGFALAFVVLHLQLARSARFVPDDLSQRASVAGYGVVGAQRQLYARWSGRWVSNGMVASAMAVLRHERAVSPYAVVLLALVVATGSIAACALLRGRVRPALAPLLAAVTAALLFFATPHRGDSWFFVFCSLENVLPLCAALLALACAVRAGEHAWLVVPGAFLAAVTTGCHESVALAALAAGGGLLGAAALRDPRDPRLRTGATMLAIALLSFAISVGSPGSAARLDTLPRTPLASALWSTAAGGPGVLLDVARAAAAPLLAVALVWAVAASVLAPVASRPEPVPLRQVAAVVAGCALLAPVVAWAATFPGYYSLGAPPPTRAQLVLAVFLVVAAAAIGSVAGAALRGRTRAEHLVVCVLVAALLGVAAVEVPRMRADVATARAYAAAYDARMALLRAIPRQRSREPVVLAPLPPSGVLRSAEIRSDDPAAFENAALRRMLRLPRPLLRARDPAPASE